MFNTSIPQNNTQDNNCPCCGEPIVIHGIQTALVPGKPDLTLMHCLNKDCGLYLATTTNMQQVWERFGSPVMKGAK